MKIVCIDSTASARLRLKQHLEQAYESARSVVGHLHLAEILVASKEEILFRAEPEAAIIGSGFAPDELFRLCRDVAARFPTCPLLIMLREESYNLQMLRRFEKFAVDIFLASESPMRLLHCLERIRQRRNTRPPGKLIAVSGAKGGVGTTTVAGALGHGAQSHGSSSVLVDLSPTGALAHYMAAPRWQSAELATGLVDGLPPDAALLDRSIVVCPNALNLFLPPAGSAEVRDLWLHDRSRLDFSLRCIELLKERFDMVIVDMASSEGLFPFAIQTRADFRLVVSSNDPASVHLLGRRISELSHLPGDGDLLILFTMLVDRGLTKDDIVDFLLLNKSFTDSMVRLPSIPYDSRGKHWIGTGNSFYTECRAASQRVFDRCISLFQPERSTGTSDDLGESGYERTSLAGLLSRIGEAIPFRRLPMFTGEKKAEPKPNLLVLPNRKLEQGALATEHPALAGRGEPNSVAVPAEVISNEDHIHYEIEALYDPPQFAVNE